MIDSATFTSEQQNSAPWTALVLPVDLQHHGQHLYCLLNFSTMDSSCCIQKIKLPPTEARLHNESHIH